ncbi:hypothetical protein [Pseudonocardia yuanmonensis]|uniref:hypothetical protein n=1 Tax=Pseudonocardia yuanmonensis TaxID=1095914 RepID=UPI0031EEE317
MTTPRLPGSGQNWVGQIDRHAHLTPDRLALVFEDEPLSWADLRSRSPLFPRRGVGVVHRGEARRPGTRPGRLPRRVT